MRSGRIFCLLLLHDQARRKEREMVRSYFGRTVPDPSNACFVILGYNDNGVVLRISLRPSPATLELPVQAPSESILVGKTRTTRGLAVSAGGSWLVAIGGHKVYVASTTDLKAGFVKFVSPEALTCLACHPTEEYVATGDEKGNIRLWYCLHENTATPKANVEKRALTTTLHWHAHAVSALAFTPNGAYLLSGGEESVLVLWQIHSGKREFVPRVGAPIHGVTVSQAQNGEEEYLLSLADASFVFINAARLKISRSYSGIKLGKCVWEILENIADHLSFLRSRNITQ
jgi:NET1-associated nuclear protein 1 (U3 small nucleolar RNA-associated protein 17)